MSKDLILSSAASTRQSVPCGKGVTLSSTTDPFKFALSTIKYLLTLFLPVSENYYLLHIKSPITVSKLRYHKPDIHKEKHANRRKIAGPP